MSIRGKSVVAQALDEVQMKRILAMPPEWGLFEASMAETIELKIAEELAQSLYQSAHSVRAHPAKQKLYATLMIAQSMHAMEAHRCWSLWRNLQNLQLGGAAWTA